MCLVRGGRLQPPFCVTRRSTPPPLARLRRFPLLAELEDDKTVTSVELVMAGEGRLKSPLTSVWLVKRALNLFSFLVLNVCITGSRGWPLPVTPSRVLPGEDSGMAEALRGRVSVPGRAQLVIQYIQGVWQCTPQTLTQAIIGFYIVFWGDMDGRHAPR